MKNYKHRYFGCLVLQCCFLLLLFNPCWSQQYNFQVYTAKNGLGSSIVNTIFQDSRGYMWFGTQGGGVSRFNGKNFRNFTKADGLVNDNVLFITEDRKKNIWVGTENGVSKFDGLKFHNYTSKEGLPGKSAYWIVEDIQGKIWIAQREAGLTVLHNGGFKNFKPGTDLPEDSEVYSIGEDSSGTIWLGFYKGIATFKNGSIHVYDTVVTSTGRVSLNNKTYFSIFVDSRKNIWFGSFGDGVLKYNGTNYVNFDLPADLKSDYIGRIAEDKKGNIWFATDHGALRYGNQSFKLFSENEGLSVNTVLSVNCDYEGNVWIGTQSGGVNLFKNEAFTNYTEKDGLSNKNITCICPSKSHNQLFLGTTNGGINVLSFASSTSTSVLQNVTSLANQSVYSVSIDENGNVWAGTQDAVYILKQLGNKYVFKKQYSKLDGQPLAMVVKILHSHGKTWLATFGAGLFCVDGKQEENFSVKTGFFSDNILTLFEDSKGNLWIGTHDNGVIKYDGSSYTQYSTTKNGFPDNAVWSIEEGWDGTMFFGTGESGLCIFYGNEVRKYNTHNGVCSDFISALKWDKKENVLWLGAEKGVNRIRFKKNMDIDEIKTYVEQNGFQAFDLNQNALFLDKLGLVWFGSPNGLCCYNPKFDLPNTIPPKIHLSAIRLAYKKVNWNDYTDSVDTKTGIPGNLALSYNNNNLTFDFHALTTDNVSYSFKLEGMDEQWSPWTTNTEASFPNITPGAEYIFKVMAKNSSGILSQETVAYKFRIKQAWWKTNELKISVVIVALLLTVVFFKARERQLKIRAEKLEQQVTEKTKELRIAKEKSDSLLLNILPLEVADELKLTGRVKPKLFENITVFFSDFKGFTTLSKILTAEEMVTELDECFSMFDEVMEDFGIEKLRTIGDAYMAVCGLPVEDIQHAEKVVLAAIVIQQKMKERRARIGERTFEVRIGINSGTALAGVVGKKKFAYDIWSDTVNVAARMEQHSLPGCINISESTYELVKEKFVCESRGEIEAKNRGMLKMFFITELKKA